MRTRITYIRRGGLGPPPPRYAYSGTRGAKNGIRTWRCCSTKVRRSFNDVERIGKTERTQEDAVFCVWFETVGKRQECNREAFPPIVLEKYEPSFGISTMRL